MENSLSEFVILCYSYILCVLLLLFIQWSSISTSDTYRKTIILFKCNLNFFFFLLFNSNNILWYKINQFFDWIKLHYIYANEYHVCLLLYYTIIPLYFIFAPYLLHAPLATNAGHGFKQQSNSIKKKSKLFKTQTDWKSYFTLSLLFARVKVLNFAQTFIYWFCTVCSFVITSVYGYIQFHQIASHFSLFKLLDLFLPILRLV